jgi:Flp pilus assembly protein TadG
MAIVLPIFGLLLLGTMEFGSIARDHQILQNAAREGARFSALPNNRLGGANSAAVLATIQNRIIAYLQNERITVTAADINVDQAYPMTIGALNVLGSKITITYQRSVIFPGITTWVPLGTMQLKGTALFRNFD